MYYGSTKCALWFFKKDLSNQCINEFEQEIASKLSLNKSKEYAYSRGYVRLALSNLFKVKPLEVPIFSIPGRQPILEDGWGYLSLSHCKDAIIIGWSSKRVGVDIERSDRKFEYKKICNRFFTPKEKILFNDLNKDYQRTFVLNRWIMKESAFKWQKNKSKIDLYGWQWNEDTNICFQEQINQNLKFFLINYGDWTMGVANSFFDENVVPNICVN